LPFQTLLIRDNLLAESLPLPFRSPFVRLVRHVVAHDKIGRVDRQSEEDSVDPEGNVTGVPVAGVEAEGDGLGEGFLAAENAAEACCGID